MIYGQNSKLGRSEHDIRYDAVHDEIVVPVSAPMSILTFRGDAKEQEAPLRAIYGPKVGDLSGSRLDIDPIHNEIVGYNAHSIRVYPREGNGDVAPLRVIEGPDTGLNDKNTPIYGIAVDPVNNIIAVGLNTFFGQDLEPEHLKETRNPGGILIFNRTDNGNVKPRNIIRGPKSGIIRINQMQIIPSRKLIVVCMPGIRDQMEPEGAFLGAWSEDDNGDVPPMYKLPADAHTTLKKPFGVALDPKHKEVIITDMRHNGVLVFSLPEIF